jgi:hypothetical protein
MHDLVEVAAVAGGLALALGMAAPSLGTSTAPLDEDWLWLLAGVDVVVVLVGIVVLDTSPLTHRIHAQDTQQAGGGLTRRPCESPGTASRR